MNMFRNIFTVALFALAVGLWLSDPDSWKWPDACGVYVVNALHFLRDTKPFSVILLFVLSLTLFMTRKQY
jgi:hypothetical protein